MNYVTFSHNFITLLTKKSVTFALPDDSLINKQNVKDMNAPNSPKKITWLIGLILGGLGIIGHYAHVQILSEYNYLLLLVGFLVLAAGTTFREI
jgi:hypothetical protein